MGNVLHPVGDLPASVYWRRRVLVIGLLLSVLGGLGWLGITALGRAGEPEESATATGSTRTSAAPPALDQVVPSLASVQVPTVPPETSAAPDDAPPAAPVVDGGPCTDDMVALEVRPTPASAAVGSKPTFDLVVTNTAAVACTRVLDKGLQEIVLLDADGDRVWGSNDCFPENSSDTRTLGPGEAVVFPVLWSGLTSQPECRGTREQADAGTYVLRGRLDADISPDAVFTLT